MPIFFKIIWGSLLSIVGNLVFRILVSLGISVVTYVGVSHTMDWMIDRGLQELRGLPSDLLGMLAYLKIGVCISMLSSAMALRAALTFSRKNSIKRVSFGD